MAATMAGMAFDNAGLGLCHALAHALGGIFHVPHGRLGGILLPHVMDFNRPAAGAAYARLARICGLGAATETLAVRALRQNICRLQGMLKLPATLKEAGITADTLRERLENVVQAAMEDRCLSGNPRRAGPEEIRAVLLEAAGI